jgi:hypothetical protein
VGEAEKGSGEWVGSCRSERARGGGRQAAMDNWWAGSRDGSSAAGESGGAVGELERLGFEIERGANSSD